MNAYIKHISYYLPEEHLTNEELNLLFPDWSVDKIAQKTGIKNRRIAGENEYASDLAVKSAEKLFTDYSINPNEIDFIIYCTQSPDYFLPTTACIIQNRLKIPNNCGALDINLGCSGYVYGLGLAKGLIETSQAKNILLLTADTYSKYIYAEDRSVRTIFGDAGAASLISTSKNNHSQLMNFVFGTDGSGAENLIVKNGGFRQAKAELNKEHVLNAEFNKDDFLYMNGPEIFNFTLKAVPRLVEDILNKSNLQIEDIDLFVFHQANKFMLDSIRKKIKIPEEKFYLFLENCGNTVSSTIPIALCEAIKENKVKRGDKVLLAGFGVGYSWGGCLLNF